MTLFSNVDVMFLSSFILNRNGKFLVCATTAWSERYLETLFYNKKYGNLIYN